MIRLLAYLLLGVIASPASLQADVISLTRVFAEREGPPISWRDILEVGDMGGVAVSPDGKHVAFVLRRAGAECGCYEQHLYLSSLDSRSTVSIANLGQPFAAVMPDGAAHGSPVTPGPRWSADGRYLAYLSNVKGRPQLAVHELKSGITLALPTPAEKPVLGFTWSVDSSQMIVQSGAPSPAVLEGYRVGLKSGFLYGEDFRGARYEQMPLVPSIPIFHGDGSIFSTSRAAVASFFRVNLDGSTAPRQTGDDKAFFASGGSFAVGPFQSPAIVRSPLRHEELVRKRRFPGALDYQVVIKSEASGEERAIRCEPACQDRLVNAFWDPVSERFVVQRQRRERFVFSLIDPMEGSETFAFEVGRPRDGFGVMEPGCDHSGGILACIEEEPNSPPRLVLIQGGGARTVLFDPNEKLRERHFNRIERIEWKNSFDSTAYGYVVYPTGYQQGRKHPLVLVQYEAAGFLRGGTGNENPVHAYAEAGFFVLVFNYPDDPKAFTQRKFENEQHRAANQYRERQAWILDSLEKVTGALTKQGLIDDKKLAYTAFSGGANFVDYALAQGHDPAVVICSQCGIGPDLDFTHPLNILSERMRLFGFPHPLVDSDYLERYRAISAALHVPRLHGAFLFNQSQFELVGAFPLYARLRHAKKPAELFVYHGEHHIKYQPNHRAAIYERNLDWLRFWLQGYEDPVPRKATQYRRWNQLRGEGQRTGAPPVS